MKMMLNSGLVEESYDYDFSEYENSKTWIMENIQYYQIK
jgi:hypothetical protein